MSFLFGTVLFATAGFLTIRATRIINLRHHYAAWPKASATIIHSEVREVTDSEGTSFRPEISYSYSISGRRFASTRHTEGMPLIHSQTAASQMVARYPANSLAIIAVNPDDPTFAVLDTGVPRQWIVIRRVSVLLAMVGLAMVIFSTFGAR